MADSKHQDEGLTNEPRESGIFKGKLGKYLKPAWWVLSRADGGLVRTYLAVFGTGKVVFKRVVARAKDLQKPSGGDDALDLADGFKKTKQRLINLESEDKRVLFMAHAGRQRLFCLMLWLSFSSFLYCIYYQNWFSAFSSLGFCSYGFIKSLYHRWAATVIYEGQITSFKVWGAENFEMAFSFLKKVEKE